MRSRTTRLKAALLAIAMLHATVPAAAQSTNAEAPRTAHSAPPPDVVRLKNGGFVRGTILESIPNDHVDIQLTSGQTRRIAWDEVEYAGPANGAAPGTPVTPPPVAPATPGADDVPVQFEAEGAEELRLHVRIGQSEFHGVGWSGRGVVSVSGHSREYASLCVAPCKTRIPLGNHRLALSTHGGKAVEAPDGVTINGPSVVRGHYESYSGTRVGGWIIFSGSLLAGMIIMITSNKKTQDCSIGADACFESSKLDTAQFAVGAGLAIVGSLVGVIMALKRDEVSFTVSPLSVAAPRFEGRPLWAGAPAEGLALTARF